MYTSLSSTQGLFSSPDLEKPVYPHELVFILNFISKKVQMYLGDKLTTRFWLSTRPKTRELQCFRIKSSSSFAYEGEVNQAVSQAVYLVIKDWIVAFIEACNSIIHDIAETFLCTLPLEHHELMSAILPMELLDNCREASIRDEDSSKSLFDGFSNGLVDRL